MTETLHATDASACRARGTAYSLAAFGFRYPDPAWVEAMRDPARWRNWPGVLSAPYPELAAPLDRLKAAAGALAWAPELETRYIALFGHTVRSSCPLYELEYGRSEVIQLTSELADITGFYAAFGLDLVPDAHERPDHLSTECEFMSVMALKEAHAAGHDDAAALDAVHLAQRKFLRDHLGRWSPAFRTRVRKADPRGFHALLADVVGALIVCECRRFNVACGPPLLEIAPMELPEDAAFACGAETNCPGGAESDIVPLGIEPSLRNRQV